MYVGNIKYVNDVNLVAHIMCANENRYIHCKTLVPRIIYEAHHAICDLDVRDTINDL